MAKKLTAVTSHLTPEVREQLEGIAEDQGFESSSAYVRHLICADIEEKRLQFERLSNIFGSGEKTERSESSQPQFMRVLAEEVGQLHH